MFNRGKTWGETLEKSHKEMERNTFYSQQQNLTEDIEYKDATLKN